MVQAEISGVAFSVDPITSNHDRIIIEAALGLGESIVSGHITPDLYVIDKRRGHILEKIISEQVNSSVKGISTSVSGKHDARGAIGQQLSNEQIMMLHRIVVSIEAHYRYPVDVEWAYRKGQFYILQSRPITALAR
jgi:pyruvate,water dikinase